MLKKVAKKVEKIVIKLLLLKITKFIILNIVMGNNDNLTKYRT